MKKILLPILLVTLFAGLASCSKFLDEKPLHSLTDENAITSAAKARAAIGGIYASFQNDSWSGGLYVALASKAGFFNYSALDYALGYRQTSGGNSGCWQAFYKSLNAANFAIAGISKLTDKTITTAEKEALLAEARCLRAWINANLLWNFCHWWAADDDPYGLLYRDEILNLTNVQKARINVGDSYKKIFEDLDAAIAKMNDFTTPRYTSKQFAKALKAKLLLYRGGYRKDQAALKASLDLVNDVLQSSPAIFTMEAKFSDVYKNAWDSKENLFARYLDDNGSRTSMGGYYYTYGIIYNGNKLPLPVGGTLTAGLRYGLDWFKADPRWDIETGPVRAPETWDNTMCYTFKKLARLGSYAGKNSNPPDEKYAAYYFRYPELYLMKAELLARTGASAATAIAPVNEMRSKRTDIALPALAPASTDEAMDMIFREIFIELFLENGSEFFAAVRFQKSGQPWIVTIKDGKALEENRMCWPVPDAEIVNNPLMKQNVDLN